MDMEQLQNREPGVPPRFSAQEMQEIRRLLRWVSRRSRARQIAEDLLDGILPSEEAVAEGMAMLWSSPPKRWRERAALAWMLGRVPLLPSRWKSAVETLCAVLNGKPKHNVAGCLLSGCLFQHLMIFWLAYVSVMDGRINRVRAFAARSLGNLCSAQSAGALAAAAVDTSGLAGSQRVREVAVEALPTVLSSLTPAHYGQLPAETVPNLCRLLYHPNENLAIRVLEALGKVGDGRAVGSVESLSKSFLRPPLREAVDRVLPILHQRLQREREAATLLRPAKAPTNPADILLRPAQGVPDSDTSRLLRPVEEEAEQPISRNL